MAITAAVHAQSVSVNGTLTQLSDRSTCNYSLLSATAAGSWTVTCGSGTKLFTIMPALTCGSVCNSYTGIGESASGDWTVTGCVPAAGNSVTLNPPPSQV